MEIMGATEKKNESILKNEKHEDTVQTTPRIESEPAKTEPEEPKSVFSDANLMKTDRIVTGETRRPVIFTPEDKVAYIDAICANTRFTKDYVLFGGKVTLTIRSLTNDEVNALSAWIVKNGSSDTAGLISGRYRKYLAAAQVECLNGIKMPALEQPLFETLAKDGKTVVPPGWLERCAYWEGMSTGLFDTVIERIRDFDALYAELTKKAEDANFWNPDTP